MNFVEIVLLILESSWYGSKRVFKYINEKKNLINWGLFLRVLILIIVVWRDNNERKWRICLLYWSVLLLSGFLGKSDVI